MARTFFVNPKSSTRLYPWGEGENAQYWIDVKEQLSTKEEKDVQAAGIPHMLQKASAADAPQADQKDREVKMGLDMGRMSIVRASKFILAWSLLDNDGHPVPLSEAAIGELDPESFDAIEKALDAHKTAVLAKKAQAPATTSGSKSA